MYKILVCDDEKWIREGISTVIDWAAIGIDMVLTARDGAQAIDITREQKPDVVITDIKMPNTDGLEMIDAIRKIIDPKCVIVISGFSSFHYAQTALKLGVADYILKPVEEDALVTAVQKCLAFKRREQTADTNPASAVLDQLNLWLNRISTVPPGRDALLGAFGIDIAQVPFVRAAVWRHNAALAPGAGPPEAPVLPQTGGADSHEGLYLLFRSHESRLTGLFFSGREDTAPLPLQDIVSEKKQEPAHAWYTGVGNRLPFADGWLSCQQAEAALMYGLIFPKQRVFYYNLLADQTEKTLDHFTGFNILQPITLLANRRFSRYKVWVNHIFEIININNNVINPKELKEFFVKLVNTIGRVWKFDGNEFREFQAGIEAAWHQDTLFKAFTAFPEKLPLYQVSGVKHGFSQALEFIEKNYGREINMAQTAAVMGLNPSYFSKMFSECAGIPFLKFLTRFRMEKARMMLRESNEKIYEIAEKTGYSDYRVFSRNFREFCGVSPADYRKQML